MRIKFESTPAFYPIFVLTNYINNDNLCNKIINILKPSI